MSVCSTQVGYQIWKTRLTHNMGRLFMVNYGQLLVRRRASEFGICIFAWALFNTTYDHYVYLLIRFQSINHSIPYQRLRVIRGSPSSNS